MIKLKETLRSARHISNNKKEPTFRISYPHRKVCHRETYSFFSFSILHFTTLKRATFLLEPFGSTVRYSSMNNDETNEPQPYAPLLQHPNQTIGSNY